MGHLVEETCPACMYKRNRPGRPIAVEGRMSCLDCGGQWKEVRATNSSRSRGSPNPPKAIVPLQRTNFFAGHADNIFSKSRMNAPVRSSASGWIGGIMFAGFFAFLAILQFLPLAESLLSGESLERLEVSQVVLHERSSQGGGKVFIVRGHLSNATDQSQEVSKIAIVLKKNNGKEVLRWYHLPSTPVIKAGRKLQFASSVFHPAALAAYAEAHLVN